MCLLKIPYDFTYMWNLKNNINEQTRQKQSHRYREQTVGCQRRRGWGAWGVAELGKNSEGIKKYRSQLQNSHELRSPGQVAQLVRMLSPIHQG